MSKYFFRILATFHNKAVILVNESWAYKIKRPEGSKAECVGVGVNVQVKSDASYSCIDSDFYGYAKSNVKDVESLVFIYDTLAKVWGQYSAVTNFVQNMTIELVEV